MSAIALRPLSEIQRVAPETLLAPLKASGSSVSADAGLTLLANARAYGLEMRDYLRLAVDPTKSNSDEFEGLNGYEASLKYLNLPVADDFEAGVVLDLASDTFQASPGTRALFPEVIDDMVRWKYRQDRFEQMANLVSSTRTISGVEMISTVVDDRDEDYKVMRSIAELAPMPVKSIRTSQSSVKMYKIGGGYRTSYEFSRRARLDLLTPYAARMNRELEMSKVGVATSVLINGDGVQAGASIKNQSAYNNAHGAGAATNGQISYKHLLQWLIERAKAGTPVDTVVGNWGAYIDWLFMFAIPGSGSSDKTPAQNMAAAGFRIGGVPLLNGQVNFALSSTMPDNQLLGYTKDETLEELIEAGSLITESERAIATQSISYFKSEVSGVRLVFGDTRQIYNYGA